jgi:hypothetical protein
MNKNEPKPRFNRIKKRVAKKAMSELKASANPMEYLKDKSYLQLKGKKGVAV